MFENSNFKKGVVCLIIVFDKVLGSLFTLWFTKLLITCILVLAETYFYESLKPWVSDTSLEKDNTYKPFRIRRYFILLKHVWKWKMWHKRGHFSFNIMYGLIISIHHSVKLWMGYCLLTGLFLHWNKLHFSTFLKPSLKFLIIFLFFF